MKCDVMAQGLTGLIGYYYQQRITPLSKPHSCWDESGMRMGDLVESLTINK
jgi:hypothetical protein